MVRATASDIGLVAFRIQGVPRTSHATYRRRRRKDLEAVFKEANSLGLRDLILPGWTFVYSPAEARRKAYQRDLTWLRNRTRHHRLRVLAELSVTQPATKRRRNFTGPPPPLGFMVIDRGTIVGRPVRQLFATSAQVSTPHGPYDDLCKEIVAGDRLVKFGRHRLLLLICGENNLLRNIQSQRNRVVLRHEGTQGLTLKGLQALPYDVAVNPAHTRMGNLGKMHKRWAALSAGGPAGGHRIAVFVTNGRGVSPKSLLYRFRPGTKPLDGGSAWNGKRWVLKIVSTK